MDSTLAEDGYISNLYNYQLINKSNMESEIEFKVKGYSDAIIEVVGDAPITKKNDISEGALFIKIDGDELKSTRARRLTTAHARLVTICASTGIR